MTFNNYQVLLERGGIHPRILEICVEGNERSSFGCARLNGKTKRRERGSRVLIRKITRERECKRRQGFRVVVT